MSGLLALWNRDGAPVEEGLFSRMRARLDHRGRDGADARLLGSVALAHQHFWTTPEEVGERQPLSDGQAQVHLAYDGRLDNRAELLAALGLHDAASRALSDAALLLRAYVRWGEGCFARTLGPLAAVVYDARAQRLVCARDVMGDRPLFYADTPRAVMAASEEYALLAHAGVSDRLDEVTLACYCALRLPTDGRTFFADVRELPPGHLMVVDAGGLRCERFDQLDLETRLSGWSDDEYAARFLDLLDEAVRRCMRAPQTPGVMMSGGLDSPSVAALAARQLAENGSGPLRTFSYIFDGFPECDERQYIQAMVERRGLDAHYVLGDPYLPLQDLDTPSLDPNCPMRSLYRQLVERVWRDARDSGVRVLLTGHFGD
ncbi:MAG: asparagine synthase-related protein, partial [Chloroflexota bacterium]